MTSLLRRRDGVRPVGSLRTGASALACATALLCACAATASAASPVSLLVPPATAFGILGHSCGGIREQSLITGWDRATGHPVGDVYLRTSCSSGGRGSPPAVFTAWASVTWDFAGGVSSDAVLATAPSGLNPALSLIHPGADTIFNTLTAINVQPPNCTVADTTYCFYAAHLSVVAPAVPTRVTASQIGDQFRVGWLRAAPTAPMILSSTLTATPVRSAAPVLSATVAGTAIGGLVGPLQPLTTYAITVVNTDAGGSSPAGGPVTLTTPASTVVPSAPTGVTARWTAPGSPGDALAAAWRAASPGDSPIDDYQITVAASDPGGPAPGPFTQSVAGSAFTASFPLDDSFDWRVQARAHNAAGWGAWSAPIVLPAA